MIIQGGEIADGIRDAIPWLDKIVDTLIETWNATPLDRRVTIGVIVIIAAVVSKWLIPAIAELVKAFAGAGRTK